MESIEADRAEQKKELEKQSMMAAGADMAPTAINQIRDVIGQARFGRVAPLNQAVEELERQLAVADVRKKLRGLIPSVIQGVVIDLEGRRYSVKTLTGELSGWRSVAAFAAKITSRS